MKSYRSVRPRPYVVSSQSMHTAHQRSDVSRAWTTQHGSGARRTAHGDDKSVCRIKISADFSKFTSQCGCRSMTGTLSPFSCFASDKGEIRAERSSPPASFASSTPFTSSVSSASFRSDHWPFAHFPPRRLHARCRIMTSYFSNCQWCRTFDASHSRSS